MGVFVAVILLSAAVTLLVWFIRRRSVTPNQNESAPSQRMGELDSFSMPVKDGAGPTYRRNPAAHKLLLTKFHYRGHSTQYPKPVEWFERGPVGIKTWVNGVDNRISLERAYGKERANEMSKSYNWKPFLVRSWTDVLGEEPRTAIQRFIKQGLLERADLAGQLNWQYTAPDLKGFLKERKLPVSGRKGTLLERLIQADPKGMKKLAGDLVAYRCSEKGREIAEQFLLEEKNNAEKAREDAFSALERHEFKQAWQIMTSYNAQRVFSQGLMTDVQEFVGKCRAVFAFQPKVLASLDSKQIEQLRCMAAMAIFAWEEYPSYKWWPDNWLLPPRIPLPGMPTDPTLTKLATAERQTLMNPAVVIFLFRRRGWIHARLAQERLVGVRTATILVRPDACAVCQALANKRYRIDSMPIIPNENCTSIEGCKCKVLPHGRAFPW